MKRIAVIIIVGILVCLPAWAGTWREDFNDGKLNGWKEVFGGGNLPQPQGAKWIVVQGVVRGEIPAGIKLFPGILFPSAAHALLLSPVTIEGEIFEVEHIVRHPNVRGGKLGTVVSQKSSEDKKYVFALHFTGDLDYGELILSDRRIYYKQIGVNWIIPKERAQGQIRVKFQKPRFEVYLSGNKIFEFEDVNFQPEAVGFYIDARDEVKAEGFFDDFVLSGPGIPDSPPVAVEPKFKLTTTWGKIKANR